MIDHSDYSERWVAFSGDDLVATGDSAVSTYREALQRDPNEDFRLHYVAEPGEPLLILVPLMQEVRAILSDAAAPLYLVGGVVRDAVLERLSHDLDFVAPRAAIQLTFRLANALGAPAYVLDAERETGRIVMKSRHTTLDIAQYRGPDLLADLEDRDFTINALALPVSARARGAIIDPTNGLADLEAGVLRLTHPAAIDRDPVRALRGIRLAAALDFVLLEETKAAMRAAAAELGQVSAERIRDESVRIVQTGAYDSAVSQLQQLGLLAVILPEIADLEDIPQSAPHHEAVLAHTISVMRYLLRIEEGLFAADPPADALMAELRLQLAPYLEELHNHRRREIDGGLDGRTILRLAALFHDAGKRATMTRDEDGRYRFFGHAEVGADLAAFRLRELCFSNEAIAEVRRTVAGHMRPLLLAEAQGKQPTRRAAYRYFKATGANGLDVGLLSLADHLATYDGPGDRQSWDRLVGLVAALFAYYFQQYEETVKPVALLNGRQLMQELQMPPGPEVGRLLSLIEEGQAAGEVTTREEALFLARREYVEVQGGSNPG